MGIALTLYALFVTALTVAEWRRDRRAQSLLKPACALGFIIIALISGSLETRYGQIILSALIFCAVGDIALLSRTSHRLFLIGMAAFGLGHGVFAFAFMGPDQSRASVITGLLLALGLVAAFGRFIWTGVPKYLRMPVSVYILIIAAMVITAMGYAFATQIWVVGLAAMMFAVSDFFVGRDRFIAPAPWHAVAITPLYFGAQALFALSVNAAL